MKLAHAVFVALGLLFVDVASAHGPCNCTFPELGRGGPRVRITSPAYRVIINPKASDFTIEPGGLESAYRPNAPTATLLSLPRQRPRPRRGVRIPKQMPPGIYLLLIYDGSEGGQHYTWDYFHVLGEAAATTPPRREPPQAEDSDSDFLHVLLGAGVAALAIGVIGWGWRRIRLTRRSL